MGRPLVDELVERIGLDPKDFCEPGQDGRAMVGRMRLLAEEAVQIRTDAVARQEGLTVGFSCNPDQYGRYRPDIGVLKPL